jgi:hypothetical protein
MPRPVANTHRTAHHASQPRPAHRTRTGILQLVRVEHRPIGAAAGLVRDTPIHHDTYTNSEGRKEPRLVWHYRPAS